MLITLLLTVVLLFSIVPMVADILSNNFDAENPKLYAFFIVVLPFLVFILQYLVQIFEEVQRRIAPEYWGIFRYGDKRNQGQKNSGQRLKIKVSRDIYKSLGIIQASIK